MQRAEFTKHLDQESLEHGSPHKDKGSRGHGDIAANAVNDSPTSTLSSSAGMLYCCLNLVDTRMSTVSCCVEGSSSSDHHRPSKRSHSGGRHKSRDSRRSRKIQVEEEEFSPSLPTMVTEVGALLRDVTNRYCSIVHCIYFPTIFLLNYVMYDCCFVVIFHCLRKMRGCVLLYQYWSA